MALLACLQDLGSCYRDADSSSPLRSPVIDTDDVCIQQQHTLLTSEL